MTIGVKKKNACAANLRGNNLKVMAAHHLVTLLFGDKPRNQVSGWMHIECIACSNGSGFMGTYVTCMWQVDWLWHGSS